MKQRTYRALKGIESIAALIIVVGFIGFLNAWRKPQTLETTQPYRQHRDTSPSRTAAILPPPMKLKQHDNREK